MFATMSCVAVSNAAKADSWRSRSKLSISSATRSIRSSMSRLNRFRCRPRFCPAVSSARRSDVFGSGSPSSAAGRGIPRATRPSGFLPRGGSPSRQSEAMLPSSGREPRAPIVGSPPCSKPSGSPCTGLQGSFTYAITLDVERSTAGRVPVVSSTCSPLDTRDPGSRMAPAPASLRFPGGYGVNVSSAALGY